MKVTGTLIISRTWTRNIYQKKTLTPILHPDLKYFKLYNNEFHTSFLHWKDTVNAKTLHTKFVSNRQKGYYTMPLVGFIKKHLSNFYVQLCSSFLQTMDFVERTVVMMNKQMWFSPFNNTADNNQSTSNHMILYIQTVLVFIFFISTNVADVIYRCVTSLTFFIFHWW